jgi:regulator of sigma D
VVERARESLRGDGTGVIELIDSAILHRKEDIFMFKSVKGIYRNGQIELSEPLPDGAEGQVLVTFLESGAVNLFERGIDEQQATDLRHRLSTFAEDWEQPEMDVYDAV